MEEIILNTGSRKKNLIIIYDDKFKCYANHLMQLIGLKDDNDIEVIGVKDGTVKAVMWDEKKYKDSEMTITSDEKLIFLGRSKMTKLVNENTKKKYCRYGIEYGWLGNRAVITVNKEKLSKEDYQQFIKEAQLNAKKLDDKLTRNIKSNSTLAGASVASIFGAGVFNPLALPVLGPVILIAAVVKFKNDLIFQNRVRKQRINFSVLKFYYEHLAEFVGE